MIEGKDSGGMLAFGMTGMSLTETRAGNLLLLLLFLAALPLIPRLRSSLRRDVTMLAAGLFGAFVLFCAPIRWQPWNGRFHLSLFMLASVLVAIVFVETCDSRIMLSVACFAIVGAAPFVLMNTMRPLVEVKLAHRRQATPSIFRMSRNQMYFADQHLYLFDSFLAAKRLVEVSGCRNVGLDASVLHYDYPMLALLHAGLGGPTVQYVDVHNRSAAFSNTTVSPCAVICLGCALIDQKSIQYGGSSLSSASFDRVEMFFSPALRPPHESTGGSYSVTVVRCDLFSSDVLQQLLGVHVSAAAQGPACVYNGGNARLSVIELSSARNAPTFGQLTSEGMGSRFLETPGYSAAIVFDGGRTDQPVLMYLAKDNHVFAADFERLREGATADDFVRIARALAPLSSHQLSSDKGSN